MSGVELTLAILPLVISAAEHQNTIRTAGKTLFSSKTKSSRQLGFYWELYDELNLLSANLKRLIGNLPSFARDERISHLIHKEQQSHIGDLGVALEDALGSHEEPFQSILDRILRSLEAIVRDKTLALNDSDTKSPNTMLAKLERFKLEIERGEEHQAILDRFRFTTSERTRIVALHQIRKGNKNMERLIRGLLKPLSDNSPQPLKRKMTPLTRTRRLSVPVFDKMAGKLSSPCDCKYQHEARLCLWNCCSSERHPESDDSLDLVVSIADFKQGVIKWQESTVLVSAEKVSGQNAAQPTVHFVLNDGSPPQMSSPTSPGRDIDSESLCTLIHQAHRSGSSLRIIYQNGKLWQITSKSRNLRIQGQNDTPLKSLLGDSSRRLKLREKWKLAAILAHAVLHCSDSPWLSNDWSKEHIRFFQNDKAGGLDIGRPYLAVNFNQQSGDVANVDLFTPHSNPALFSLAILLLEIHLSQPIESCYAQEDLTDGQPNEYTNVTTAERLLQRLEDDLTIRCYKVIQACLEYDQALAIDGGVDKADLRTQLYEEIVKPLELDFEDGCQQRPEDLRLGA